MSSEYTRTIGFRSRLTTSVCFLLKFSQFPSEFLTLGSVILFLRLPTIMGFFKSCAETLIQLLSFNSISSFGPWSQQPLSGLPIGEVSVHPHGASNSFTCEYPTLKGWKSCNTAHDRSCWLKDTSSKQPLFSQYE